MHPNILADLAGATPADLSLGELYVFGMHSFSAQVTFSGIPDIPVRCRMSYMVSGAANTFDAQTVVSAETINSEVDVDDYNFQFYFERVGVSRVVLHLRDMPRFAAGGDSSSSLLRIRQRQLEEVA